MNEFQFSLPIALDPYVNSIMVMDCDDPETHTRIPIYADGYPGIMFQQSTNGCYLLPRNKKLSELFLYGQTIQPVSLEAKGTFRWIVFQLYPFVSKYLLGVNPKELNDDCFDLLQLEHVDVRAFARELRTKETVEKRVETITALMLQLIESNRAPDDRIQEAISLILQYKGQTSIKALRDRLYMTERTLERQFVSQVGLTPKQFAKIIQFQSSLHQLSQAGYDQLGEVGLDSGFADQSHFTRTFKKYTGKTPSEFSKQNRS